MQEASPRRPWDVPGFASWLAVIRAYRTCAAAMAAALEPLDLSLSQYDILANLARHPGLTQSELVEQLLVGKSAVSMTLPDLERRGFVFREKDAADGRVRRLRLTASGTALADRALAVHADVLDTMMAGGAPGEAAQVEAAMVRIYQTLKATRRDG